jgi:hypothetical protein
MLPPVREVVSVEMIRDGGSLSVKFESEGSSQYILLVRIQLVDRGSLVKETMGYDPPILIDCDPKGRPPDTATVRYSELGGPSVSISWSQAREILGTVASLVQGITAIEAKWLEKLIDVANREGQLPPDAERLTQWRRF